jgi:4-amino-4-deoxy-L-arabinose transferase-like glycosyltransferase
VDEHASTPVRIALFAALLSTAVRAYLAHRHFGFQPGDDLEIAEEAFRRAVGLVHTPWNVRSLFIPDVLVAPFVKLAWLLGMRDPLHLLQVARVPFLALSALNVMLVFALGRRWFDERTGAIAALLYSAHWIPLLYGSSLFPRVLAVTCILLGALVLSREQTLRAGMLAGVLASLAITARFSEAIFLISLLLIAQNRRTIAGLLAGFAIGATLFVGLYDRLTWGRWFGSLIAFAELTFIRRDASSLIVSHPPWWYLTNLPNWIAVTLLPLLCLAAWRTSRRRFLTFVALPVLALSVIFHKELRYLQVVIPFAMLLAAHGYTLFPRRRIATALLVLSLILGLGRIRSVEKRSTNAVLAARWIAAQRPQAVALSQAWAYGGRLFLGNTSRIEDIGSPPDVRMVGAADYVGVYASDVGTAFPGYVKAAEFRDRGGRAVLVFRRR